MTTNTNRGWVLGLWVAMAVAASVTVGCPPDDTRGNKISPTSVSSQAATTTTGGMGGAGGAGGGCGDAGGAGGSGGAGGAGGDEDPCGGGTNAVATWSTHSKDPSGEELGTRVAVDGTGAVIAGGTFTGAVNFGSALTSAGAEDVFIVKTDPAGEHLFSKRFGGIGVEQLRGIAVDGAGNIVLVGMFNDSISFGDKALTAPNKSATMFFAKLDKDGSHLVSYAIVGDMADHQAQAVALDAQGNVYVTGQFKGVMDFETASGGSNMPAPLTATDGFDIFLAKLDPDGKHVFSKSFGTTGDQQAWDVAVTPNGNIALAGTFTGEVDFGGGKVSNTTADGFVAMLDKDGAHLFTKQLAGAEVQEARAIAFDASGDVLVGGHFSGAFALGNQLYSSKGSDDGFVVKLSGTTGEPLFGMTFGDAATQRVLDLAIGTGGSTFAVGTSAGTVKLGGTYKTKGEADALVFKLDATGMPIWAGLYGDIGADAANACAADANGDLVVVGDFVETIDLGAGKATTVKRDAFIAKFAGMQP